MNISEIRKQFPMYADVPDEQLVIGLHKKHYSDMPFAEFHKNISYDVAPDPTQGMSTGEKALAGAGKGFADFGRGAAQLVGLGPSGEQVAETRQRDAALMKTGAGLAGNIGANVLAAVPALYVPGVNSYAGAAALGGISQAFQPAESLAERALNVAVGTGFGAAGQGVGNALARVARPVQSTLSPEAARLAGVAMREGIPLDAAAQTGSKPLQTLNAVFENLPLTAGRQAEQAAARSGAFNAAVLRRAGISSDSATPAVLGAQKQALGSQFESIAGRNVVDFNGGTVANDLASVAHEASRRLPNAGSRVTNTIDDLLNEVGQNGVMQGAKYQGWRSELGRLARGNDAEAHYFGQVKKALDRAFSSQVSGADAAAWSQASREYGNLKTILNAMGGAGNDAAASNIAPAQLAAALRQAVGREGRALGRGDLDELVRVGQLFVRDQVPNSGTAQRQLMQSLVTGGGGAVVGAGAAGATGNDKWQGALYGAGAGAASLLAPRLAQALVQSGPAQRYMTNQANRPAAIALERALQASGRTLGLALPAVQQ